MPTSTDKFQPTTFNKEKTSRFYNRDVRPAGNFKHWKRSGISFKVNHEHPKHFEKVKIPFGSTWKCNSNNSSGAISKHLFDQQLDWRRSMTKSLHCGVIVELDV